MGRARSAFLATRVVSTPSVRPKGSGSCDHQSPLACRTRVVPEPRRVQLNGARRRPCRHLKPRPGAAPSPRTRRLRRRLAKARRAVMTPPRRLERQRQVPALVLVNLRVEMQRHAAMEPPAYPSAPTCSARGSVSTTPSARAAAARPSTRRFPCAGRRASVHPPSSRAQGTNSARVSAAYPSTRRMPLACRQHCAHHLHRLPVPTSCY
jgi:hypothetical protein